MKISRNAAEARVSVKEASSLGSHAPTASGWSKRAHVATAGIAAILPFMFVGLSAERHVSVTNKHAKALSTFQGDGPAYCKAPVDSAHFCPRVLLKHSLSDHLKH